MLPTASCPSHQTTSPRAPQPLPPAHSLSGPFEMVGAAMNFGRNMEIYGESEPADYVYKVVSGAVRAYRTLHDGRRQIAAFYLPGDTFGLEVDSTHVCSAEAITDSIILVVKRRAIVSQANRDPKIAQQMWTLAGQELQRFQSHMLLLVKNAQERIATFLLEMADRIATSDEVHLPMSRQDIADYLGLTMETISRTLTQLENEEAIALPTSRHVVLRNRTALNSLNA